MADLLAEVGELAGFIGAEIDSGVELLLLELATGAVQAAAGQRIVRATSEVELLGSTNAWLPLPERPVVSVESVEIDGAAVTDFELRGTRLWRGQGWASSTRLPSTVTVAYTHGFLADDPGVQPAKQATLLVAAQMHANPTGATGFGIDDYREQYSQASGAGIGGEIPESLRRSLRRKYGPGVWALAIR